MATVPAPNDWLVVTMSFDPKDDFDDERETAETEKLGPDETAQLMSEALHGWPRTIMKGNEYVGENMCSCTAAVTDQNTTRKCAKIVSSFHPRGH